MSPWLTNYITVLESLSSADLPRLRACISEDIKFKDPFNDTSTQDEFIAIMDDMYSRLDKVHFKVHSSAEYEHEAFIEWTFYGESKLTGTFSFVGTSKLISDQSGKVTHHFDYWDGSALMEKIPLIGFFIRQLRGRFSHKN